MSKHQRRRKSMKVNLAPRKCQLESLERRELMSVNNGAPATVSDLSTSEIESLTSDQDYVVASQQAGRRIQVALGQGNSGILNITGTNESDDILVRQNERGQVVVELEGNRVYRTPRGTQINRINVDGFGGHDRIKNDTDIFCVMTGGKGNDTLIGGGGSDTLVGQRGNDQLFGCGGDDTLLGLNGKDRFDGGRGNDFADHRETERGKSIEEQAANQVMSRAQAGIIISGPTPSTPTNEDPVAKDNTFNTFINEPKNFSISELLRNDYDPDGRGYRYGLKFVDIERFSIYGGRIVPEPDGSYRYEPAEGFHGKDSFRYTIQDRDGAKVSAWARFNVNKRPSPPIPVYPGGGNGADGNTKLTPETPTRYLPTWLSRAGNNNWEVAGSELADTVIIKKVALGGGYGHDIAIEYNGETYTVGYHRNVRRITFLGGEGNDLFVNQTSKPAYVDGQGGDDEIRGGSGKDVLHGGDGNDRIYGGAGNDILRGDAGNDELFGGRHDDRLNGGAGDDRLKGGKGKDSLRNGREKVVGDNKSSNKTTTSTPTKTEPQKPGVPPENSGGDSSATDTLPGWLTQVGGNWQIEGTNQADRVAITKVGSDIVVEFNGQTHSLGDAGAVKNIAFLGNAGDDYFKNSTKKSVNVNGGAGNDEIHGGAGRDDLRGGDGDDHIYGGAGADTIRGGNGQDALHGQDGNDILKGGAGDDQLYGEAGDDRLNGEEGKDILRGGKGADYLIALDGAIDQLFGGNGDDRFQVNKQRVIKSH